MALLGQGWDEMIFRGPFQPLTSYGSVKHLHVLGSGKGNLGRVFRSTKWNPLRSAAVTWMHKLICEPFLWLRWIFQKTVKPWSKSLKQQNTYMAGLRLFATLFDTMIHPSAKAHPWLQICSATSHHTGRGHIGSGNEAVNVRSQFRCYPNSKAWLPTFSSWLFQTHRTGWGSGK